MGTVDAPAATHWIKAQAASLGFERCGVARPAAIGRGDYLRAWLAAGRAGSMAYLHRNIESRLDPSNLLVGARSAIVVALNYNQPAPDHQPQSGDASPTSATRFQCRDRGGAGNGTDFTTVSDPRASARAARALTSGATGGSPASASDHAADRGRVARYAWGRDYHRVVKRKLHKLADAMRERFGDDLQSRACVDTAPIMERELATKAGVGWIGKNTLVLHPDLGSYLVLGVLLTTLELEPDPPVDDHCGSCTACLDACPTAAFPAPYEMDASRCISYLTIEHRGAIPVEFHQGIGDWVFGCDVCQEVCPFNRRAPITEEPDFAIRTPGPRPTLASILDWTPDDYDRETRGSATRRATLAMWKRNAEIAATNASENTSR